MCLGSLGASMGTAPRRMQNNKASKIQYQNIQNAIPAIHVVGILMLGIFRFLISRMELQILYNCWRNSQILYYYGKTKNKTKTNNSQHSLHC
jgi:hypothetical protein